MFRGNLIPFLTSWHPITRLWTDPESSPHLRITEHFDGPPVCPRKPMGSDPGSGHLLELLELTSCPCFCP